MTDPTTSYPECTCPLIDVSRFGPRGGVEIAFLRGDPRGSGCPLHETEAMREERRLAEHTARYGKPEPAPIDITWVATETHKHRDRLGGVVTFCIVATFVAAIIIAIVYMIADAAGGACT